MQRLADDLDASSLALSSNPLVVEKFYRSLKRVRRVEEVAAEIYPSDKIKSPMHLSIGQESVAVGVSEMLREDDFVSGTYRGHATYIAKGGCLKAMMAELFGKKDGCAHGRGGSMHLIGVDNQIIGSSAVVGTTIPIAMGHAFALKREGRGRVVVAFLGDGATEEGVFWESLNFSVLQKLPIFFVCENNGLAIHEPLEKRWGVMDLVGKVESFGLPTVRIEDANVFTIAAATRAAIEPMRTGQAGPAFIECLTYRWREHVGPGDDFDSGYRPRDEFEAWVARDEIARLADMLDAAIRNKVDNEIEQEIEEAVIFAEGNPMPPPEELEHNVFAE